MKDIKNLIENRRTYYEIDKTSPISDEEIREIVEHSINYVPSAFNSQSSRVVLLFGDQHDKLWEITRETLRKIVPADSFSSTDAKIDGFKKDMEQYYSLRMMLLLKVFKNSFLYIRMFSHSGHFSLLECYSIL